MRITVTRTKILQPKPRPDLLSRSRLLQLLDDVLDYPFTLISAPAGYGKTSLLVDLAHKAEYPVCWLSLDPLDQDLKRFLTHLLASISLKFPNFGSHTLSVLNNSQSLTINLDQLVHNIVNDLVKNIQEHFVVILDDYHWIENNQQISQFLSRFGQEMDENCHLIITSRKLFDLPDLSLMRQVGLSIAVSDAHKMVREQADWITSAPGGCGAVREVCEALLTAQGIWEKMTAHFSSS